MIYEPSVGTASVGDLCAQKHDFSYNAASQITKIDRRADL